MLTFEIFAVSAAVIMIASIITMAVHFKLAERAERSLMTPEQKKRAQQEAEEELYIW